MNPHPNIPPKKQDPPSVGASLHETKKTGASADANAPVID